MYYMLRAFARQWNEVDVKITDRVQILTFADADMLMWQPIELQHLAISAEFGGVVLARERVSQFHPAMAAFHQWACPQPGKLSRILRLALVLTLFLSTLVFDARAITDAPADGIWVY